MKRKSVSSDRRVRHCSDVAPLSASSRASAKRIARVHSYASCIRLTLLPSVYLADVPRTTALRGSHYVSFAQLQLQHVLETTHGRAACREYHSELHRAESPHVYVQRGSMCDSQGSLIDTCGIDDIVSASSSVSRRVKWAEQDAGHV